MSKIYKIGRCYYKQVSEKKSFDYPQEKVFALMSDGDPVMFFIRINKQDVKRGKDE